MANIFQVTRKKRDNELEKATAGEAAPAKPSAESQPSVTMSQADFSYGPEGMRRKPKSRPPASMNP